MSDKDTKLIQEAYDSVKKIMGPHQFGNKFIAELEELGVPMSVEVLDKYNFISVGPMAFHGKRPKTPQFRIWIIAFETPEDKLKFNRDYKKYTKPGIFEMFEYPYGNIQDRMMQIRLERI